MLCLKEVLRMMMLLVGAHDDNAFGWQDVEANTGTKFLGLPA